MKLLSDLSGSTISTIGYNEHGRVYIELTTGVCLFLDDGIGGPVTVAARRPADDTTYYLE